MNSTLDAVSPQCRRPLLALGLALLSLAGCPGPLDDDEAAPTGSSELELQIGAGALTLAPGETVKVNATVSTTSATRLYTLSWVSQNVQVASVTPDGVLLGVANGTTTLKVTATLLDTGTTATASVTVSITAPDAGSPPASSRVLSNGVAVSGLTGVFGSLTRFQITVPTGASNLRFVTSGPGGGGDVDIFAAFGSLPTVTTFTAKSDGPTVNETITVAAPQAGVWNLLLFGDWSTYAGVTLVASYTVGTTTPPTQVCPLASRSIIPAIATKAAWDQRFDSRYGSTLPDLSGNADTYAWQGHYWLRSYVSMAKTYGDTKYLDRAVTTIDYWFAHTEGSQGWGASINAAQMMLDTGVIAQAISIFIYEVWSDARFAAYRPKADAYLARLEAILHTYDAQWVDGAPYAGAPGFYRYATCGGLCSPASLIMYNQGATMAKSLLLLDRVYRLKGQTPDAGYLHKANAAAAYFKTFARLNGAAYEWDYGGARTGTGVEDTSHGHLDLSLVVWARKFGLGGLTDADMGRLVATMHKVLNGAAGPNDVSLNVDGSGLPTSNWDRVAVGFDWIELADYDATLFDKTVSVYNARMAVPEGSRFFLGWAEILRKRNCVGL